MGLRGKTPPKHHGQLAELSPNSSYRTCRTTGMGRRDSEELVDPESEIPVEFLI